MQFKTKFVLLLLLVTVSIISAGFTYKGMNFEDNQIIVLVTGAGEKSPEEAASTQLIPGSVISVPVEGTATRCRLSAFASDSQAIGRIQEGALENGVQLTDGPYITVGQSTRKNSKNWGTTELVNSLEVAGCAVFWKTGVKLKVGHLSSRNGGYLLPHISHQRGLDADVLFACKRGSRYYMCESEELFEPGANWALVKALASRTPIQKIFLKQSLIDKMRSHAANDPDYVLKQAIFTKLLQPREDHYDHFHIRLQCDENDKRCAVDQKGDFRGTDVIEQDLVDNREPMNEEGETIAVTAPGAAEVAG